MRMKRIRSAGAPLFSLKGKAPRLLLATAALAAVLYQSGCSGATAAAGQFNVNASSANLGNVVLGDSKTVMLTFTNSTNSAVTITSISISGPGFTLSGIAIGTILNPGDIAALSATFTPAATGTETGSITVTSNAQNSSITIALQATGVAGGDHSATVSWNGSTSPVTGYFVYRSPSSGGPYTPLIAAPDTSLTYTDSVVIAGQTYYYVVTAVNSDNVQSSYSNEVAATIPTP